MDNVTKTEKADEEAPKVPEKAPSPPRLTLEDYYKERGAALQIKTVE